MFRRRSVGRTIGVSILQAVDPYISCLLSFPAKCLEKTFCTTPFEQYIILAFSSVQLDNIHLRGPPCGRVPRLCSTRQAEQSTLANDETPLRLLCCSLLRLRNHDTPGCSLLGAGCLAHPGPGAADSAFGRVSDGRVDGQAVQSEDGLADIMLDRVSRNFVLLFCCYAE